MKVTKLNVFILVLYVYLLYYPIRHCRFTGCPNELISGNYNGNGGMPILIAAGW
jgi:hypothetical protein